MDILNQSSKYSIFTIWFILLFSPNVFTQQTAETKRQPFSTTAQKLLIENASVLGINAEQARDNNYFEPFSEAANLPFVYRYITGVAISPDFANDKMVFVAVYKGGIFKSIDGGLTWTPVNSGLDDQRTGIFAISPDFARDQTLFLTIRFSNPSPPSIYKSTDGGDTWTELSASPSNVVDIVLSPNYDSDQTLFAASFSNPLKKSTDGGNTWEDIGPASERFSSISLSPGYPGDSTLFGGAGGIWRSIDNGNSWQEVLNVSGGDIIALSPDYGTDSTVFASTLFNGLIRSTDAGQNWQSVLLTAIGDVVVSPDYAADQTLFAAGVGGVYKSVTGGDSWNEINTGLTNLSVEAIDISPSFPNQQTLVAGTNEGVFRTDDALNWTDASTETMLSNGIERITASQYQIDTVPTMALDSNGALHIAWWGTYADTSAPDGVVTDVHYTSNQTGSFAPPTRITVPHDYFSIWVSIATDSDNFVHLAFIRQDNLFTTAFEHTLYYVNNREGNFENLVVISEQFEPVWSPVYPSIAVDSDGAAHIAFVGGPGSPSRVWYTNNTAGAFFTPVDVPKPVLYGQPSLAVDSNDIAHIAYGGEGDDIIYANNADGDFDSTINVTESQNLTGVNWPQLALDSMGRSHIVHEGFITPGGYAMLEGDNVLTYVPIWGITPRPSLALDNNGFVHITNGTNYGSNLSGDFKISLLLDVNNFSSNDQDVNVGRRCMAISQDNIIHIVFALKASRIPGDANWEIYHVSFPADSTVVSVEDGKTMDSKLPKDFVLFQNYPNPFNPSTTIAYQLPKDSQVKVEIYNVQGQRIRTLVDSRQAAGLHSIQWHGIDGRGQEVSSGVYFYRLEASEFVVVRKLLLLR